MLETHIHADWHQSGTRGHQYNCEQYRANDYITVLLNTADVKMVCNANLCH